MQLLWYPQDYEELGYLPKIEIHWRRAVDLSDRHLLVPNYEGCDENYSVRECAVHPEMVKEYPGRSELSFEEQEELTSWEDDQDHRPEYDWQGCLSAAPGLKVGGFPPPGPGDSLLPPEDYVLTLAPDEWDGNSLHRWRIEGPDLEEMAQRAEAGDREAYANHHEPLGVRLKYAVNVYIAKKGPEWTVKAEVG